MQQFEVLRIKNELVLLFFISSMLIYGAFVTIGLFERVLFFPFTIATFFIPLAFVKYKKMSPPTIKWMIIICGNISLVFLNTMTFSFINIIWFIYFLLLISIYESRKTNVLFGIITLFEILFLIFFHFSAVKEVIRMPYLNSLIFLISILLIICGIQALYLKRFWKQVKNIKLHNEQQLHSQEAYLQLFFEHANDCIAVFSLDNRIIDVNPAFEEVYGWTRSECVGKIIQLVPQNNDEAATNRYQQLLGGQSFKLLETQDMRKDGTVFDVEISLSPIYDHNKKMVAISVISRDISYKKENEKLIIQSEKLKLAGEIAAGVAHEIRNPMTVVSGFVQMMNSDKHSPYQHYTEIIQSEIERINLIISEFLVLSKPQADHIKELSIDKVLNDTINFFQLEFQNRSITFKKHFETSDYRVQGNENQLKQVFINIIKNAIEAIDTQQSIGKIDLSISKSEKNMLEISISDNGIGISEVLLPQIFEPFYTTKTKGTGLGMMITNKIIQEHNGTITVESRPQLGTSIKIKLPII